MQAQTERPKRFPAVSPKVALFWDERWQPTGTEDAYRRIREVATNRTQWCQPVATEPLPDGADEVFLARRKRSHEAHRVEPSSAPEDGFWGDGRCASMAEKVFASRVDMRASPRRYFRRRRAIKR
ncbi:MAG: hypothetical protein SPK06_00090 [Kiritimatiellia bacterium]|nr:hypothetical protein [Kiritimatiellia bacterium]